jgi:hypothetical protein
MSLKRHIAPSTLASQKLVSGTTMCPTTADGQRFWSHDYNLAPVGTKGVAPE